VRRSVVREVRRGIALLLLIALGGCASSGAFDPGTISRLEHARDAHPESLEANRALGVAYYRAGRTNDARTALETAARIEPADGVTALYLGLAAEQLGDLAAARRAYSTYVEVGRTRLVRRQLEARLAALARRELAADARRAVERERDLGEVSASPTTIAVLPIRFDGGDSTLLPLERGFTELLTTDLARASALTVVERARVRALIDELALQRSGATDSATNVRAGRLLRAGRVIQGALHQLDDARLRVDAAVVDVPTTQVRGTTQGSDELDDLFDLEKRIALDLFRELGVTLTVAERNAVEQRPTRSLAAFLAYSRGLVEEDAGRFDDAERFFRDASRLDPAFQAAKARSAETALLRTDAGVSPRALESALERSDDALAARSRGRGRDVADAVHAAADDLNPSAAATSTVPGRARGHGPPAKDEASAATDSDKPGRSGRARMRGPRKKAQ
jgi:tetratricopeptide (TPR) repeat protein